MPGHRLPEPMALTPNTRFAAFRAAAGALPAALVVSWEGLLFRFQAVAYPTPRQILDGKGAARRGGRWNPPGVAAVYGSTTDTVALEECKAHDRYYGVVTTAPRLLVAVRAKLSRVLDLQRADVRRALGVTLAELEAEDWRRLSERGIESQAQAVGRAASGAELSGMLVPSFAVDGGLNVVVFPGRLPPGDRLEVVEGEALEKLAGGPPP